MYGKRDKYLIKLLPWFGGDNNVHLFALNSPRRLESGSEVLEIGAPADTMQTIILLEST